MPVRDILLQISSYPEPTPSWAIESAAYIAQRLGAKLSMGLCQTLLPDVSNVLSQFLVKSRDVIAAENHKSSHNALQLRRKFDEAVASNQMGETILIDGPAFATSWQLGSRSRVYDLLIVPIYGEDDKRTLAEDLIFDSGRPVLLLPPEGMAGHRFDEVVIGWDGSRAAARAVAESLGLCAQARSVTVVAVTGDKDLAGTARPAELVRHLARHGIAAETAQVGLTGDNAGETLAAYCKQSGSDLLVMGAYGHNRAREFLLGGATRSLIIQPGLPVLMAH